MASWDLINHLERQRAFSLKTFGPGVRTAGVCDHIRKELKEVEAKPDDLMEWVDVILLALDGAWRAGHEPIAIATALTHKQGRNESRVWPDWRTADPNKAIEHDRRYTEQQLREARRYTDEDYQEVKAGLYRSPSTDGDSYK